MRIAFVTPEYVTEEPRSGGLGNYLRRISSSLVRLGHAAEVFVVSGDRRTTLDCEGVLVHRVPAAVGRRWVRAMLRVLGWLRCRPLANALPVLVEAWALAAALRRRQSEVRFDLVQSADYRAAGLFVSPGRKGLHLIRCSNDDREAARLNGASLFDRVGIDGLTWLALRRADRLYAPSHFMAEHLAPRGLDVQVLRPPVFLEAKPAAAPPVGVPRRYFVHFGQIAPVKGSSLLADALVRVLEEAPDFEMVWAGRDRFGLFERCARRWGAHRHRVRHLGALERPDLYALVAGAEAAVLPSLFDNFPNTVIESLLLGVPVIGTRNASLEELIEPGRHGWLVPNGDADALADAMLEHWRGESGLRRGFVWQRDDLCPDVAANRLLELAGLLDAQPGEPASASTSAARRFQV